MYLPKPSLSNSKWYKVNFLLSKAEFSFSKTGCLTKAKEYCFIVYLELEGTDEFMPFLRVFALKET